MFRCNGLTLGGTSCRRIVAAEGNTCPFHTPVQTVDSNCSICMELMTTRNYRELSCGHLFHKKCLEKWKQEGNRTCPMCRQEFDQPEFKVTVNIEPVGPNAHRHTDSVFNVTDQFDSIVENMGIDIDELRHFSTRMTMEAEDLESLRSVLGRIGIELNDSDFGTLSATPDAE